VVKRLFRRQDRRLDTRTLEERVEAERGRMLIEESREMVVVLDEEGRVLATSRRARESLPNLEEGKRLPDGLARPELGPARVAVPYEVDGRRETLLYLSSPGDLAAYEELRSGFTAAVSHELRTPLARLLSLLETALLPGSDPSELIEQARGEVEQINELISEVLFLSELETGQEVVSLGSTRLAPVIFEVVAKLSERAVHANVRIEVEVDPELEIALRPRLLRVILENLAANAIRYAGPSSTFTLTARAENGTIVLEGRDDGVGVSEQEVQRLFERFYRADRARASRGTGLGLAIVKHIVTAAGGAVEASGGRGEGLAVRCVFPRA
jgi:two-component system phosphate regulon sensor histidine kinase PhoR